MDDSSIISSPILSCPFPSLLCYTISACCRLPFISFFSSPLLPTQPLASLLFTHPLPLAVCPPSPPPVSLHTALGKRAHQEGCVLGVLAYGQTWVFLNTLLQLCKHLCVYACVFSHLRASVSQREVRGGVTMTASNLHIFPSAPLINSAEDRPCHSCEHLPLLHLPFTSSSMPSLILQELSS